MYVISKLGSEAVMLYRCADVRSDVTLRLAARALLEKVARATELQGGGASRNLNTINPEHLKP